MSADLDFMRDRFGGSNWVLARRTPRVVAQYGEDVICVSRKRYAAVEREWRELHGDPHDKVGAELYVVLRELRDILAADSVVAAYHAKVLERADAALQAEANAK